MPNIGKEEETPEGQREPRQSAGTRALCSMQGSEEGGERPEGKPGEGGWGMLQSMPQQCPTSTRSNPKEVF